MQVLLGFLFLFNLALAKLGKDPTIQEFEAEFHKLYTPEEEAEAEKNLKAHEAAIDKENELFAEGKANFEEAVMEWDDLSPEEFLAEKTGDLDGAYGKGLIDTPEELRFNSPEDEEWINMLMNASDRASFPTFFDARTKGLITSVKNQKSCGSCSAFASAAMVETCLIRVGAPSQHMDLSEQQLVDCAYDNKHAFGCDGAFIRAYPNWLANKNQGFVNHENHYPYLNNKPNLKCQNVKPWKAGARVEKSRVWERCDENRLKELVYNYGAVVSVIYAGDQGFMDYKAGSVFDTCSNKAVNHAITVIGWGRQNGQEYWLIKNSWGDYWGDKGYIKVKKGTCGVGTRCAVTECYKAGHQNPPPKKTGVLDITPCNISAKYGPKVTGTYNIKYKLPNGKTRTTLVSEARFRTFFMINIHLLQVTCAHSSCTPENPGKAKNACYTICGRSKCGSQ